MRATYSYYGDWLSGRSLANGTYTEYLYQANGRPSRVWNSRSSPRYKNISYRTYGWAPNGQMTWFNKSYDASSGSATESDRGDAYQYYQDGTLSFVHHEAKNVFTAADSHGDSIANPLWDPAQNSPQRANSYDYDAAGNRTHVNNSGVAETYTVDAFNRVTNVRNDSTNADSAVSYVDGQGRTQGAITGLRGWTYGYDAQGRLTSATTSTGGATFAYDPLGRVALRTLSGTVTRCYYAGRQLIEERNASDQRTATWLYGVGGELVEAFANGDYFFHHDARGFVTHLTDGSNGSTKGNVIEQYLYDAFGAPLVLDAAGNQRPGNGSLVGNRFRWRDSLYFSAYGLYHLDRRFYSPSLGRFLQPDPIGQTGGLNLYAYCGNDPVNLSDPSGLTDRPTAETEENQTQPAGRPTHTSYNGGYDGPVTRSGMLDGVPITNPDYGNGSGIGSDGRVVYDYGRDANNVYTDRFGAGDSVGGGNNSRNGNINNEMSDVARAVARVAARGPDKLTGQGQTLNLMDPMLDAELKSIYDKIRPQDFAKMGQYRWEFNMSKLDSIFRYRYNKTDVSYTGSHTDLSGGTYKGYEVNYIAVGEGFAARGVSVAEMNKYIADWKLNGHPNDPPASGSTYAWARVGYDYYRRRASGE